MSRRYAIYFAPPAGSELEAFGRRWLGRDHATGRAIPQPEVEGIPPAELEAITRSARHYGFHATLKAPFALVEEATPRALHQAAEALAASQTAFEAPPLEVTGLDRYVAFTLSRASPEMNRLAEACVRAFDHLRAPSSPEDLERRRASGLTPRQDRQLLEFGYPYVFEDFWFHMTLAGPLEPEMKARVLEILRARGRALCDAPLRVDRIALYEQPSRDRPFILTRDFPFSG
jgi:putative phosphonate metabolism protein